ncbi:hypothetical protein CPB86DRAFT_828596 [Serendipita vermifera]|nr:hypothetical protein CPB86DRAFT_828596 [Serendipita vermifera]
MNKMSSTSLLACNGPPLPGQDIQLQKQINRLERKMKEIDNNLSEYKSQVRECNAELAALRLVESEMHKFIRVYGDVLKALDRALMGLRTLASYDWMKPENRTTTFPKSQKTMSNMTHNTITEAITMQMEFLRLSKKRAQDKLKDLGPQYQRWHEQRDLAKKGIKDNKSKREVLHSEIHPLKRLTSPLWKIPPEIWIEIFRLRLNADIDDYLYHSRDSTPFELPLRIWSSVCEFGER